MIVPFNNTIDVDNNIKILAYFSLSIKNIKLSPELSKSLIKRLDGINKAATNITCYLIGQLAKNDKYKSEIEGKEVLQYALNIIKTCQGLIGMRVILIECEDKKRLREFYETNDFKCIGRDAETGLLQYVTTTVSNRSNQLANMFEIQSKEIIKDEIMINSKQ